MCGWFDDASDSFQGEFPETRDSLIDRLKNPGKDSLAALDRFCKDYGRALYTRLRQGGMQPADAREILGLFLDDCLDPKRSPLTRFDPSKGRFHHFLLACLKTRMLMWIRSKEARPEDNALSLSPQEQEERDLSTVVPDPRVLEADEEWDRIWFWQDFDLAVEAFASQQKNPLDALIVRRIFADPFTAPTYEELLKEANALLPAGEETTVLALKKRKERLLNPFSWQIHKQLGLFHPGGETPPDAVKEIYAFLARHPRKKGFGDELE